MKYFETDLQESYDWPNRYYAVRVLKGRDKVIDSFYIIGADAAISNVPYLTRLTTIVAKVTVNGKAVSFQIKYCPNCGRRLH